MRNRTGISRVFPDITYNYIYVGEELLRGFFEDITEIMGLSLLDIDVHTL